MQPGIIIIIIIIIIITIITVFGKSLDTNFSVVKHFVSSDFCATQ